MNILMVAAEMNPLVKVGGLGDVTGALPSALARLGHGVRVVMPLYGDLDRRQFDLRPSRKAIRVPVRIGQDMLHLSYWHWAEAPSGVMVDLVECDELFDRPGIYTDETNRTFTDTVARASGLCQAALILPQLLDWPVDVLHAHDVHAALAPVYRRRWFAGRELPGSAASLLTIHNLAHQEVHPPEAILQAGLPLSLTRYPNSFEFFGHLNLLKGGIVESDLVNTVSPTYAREAVTDPAVGCGLEGVLASRGTDFCGILNGVDYSLWDPSSDPHLPAGYDADDLSGKEACRRQLMAQANLNADHRPVLGLVGRLVAQKGIDLVLPLLDRMVAGGFSLVVLGTGAPAYHAALISAVERHPGRVAFWPEFSEAKAHLIYAGCDIFLMPSRFEPCGLSQLYALRYGTPPVVRRTGGLADTVSDAALAAGVDSIGASAGATGGTGFHFIDSTAEALWEAMEAARGLFSDQDAWRALQRRGMASDFSWDAAAANYVRLYRRLAPGAARAIERSRA
jgi:starch synthase